MLPNKQWPFIPTSNLVFSITACNERVTKHIQVQGDTKKNRRSSIDLGTIWPTTTNSCSHYNKIEMAAQW